MRYALALVVVFLWGWTARADVVFPISYTAPNGGAGFFTYYDDTYLSICRLPESGLPFCDINVPYTMVSGGTGQLTDLQTAGNLNWWRLPTPWVGWMQHAHNLDGDPCAEVDPDCFPGLGTEPVIEFTFETLMEFSLVQIHVDDANNYGGVKPPWKAELSDGITTKEFFFFDPPEGVPIWLTMDASGLIGTSLLLKLFFGGAWILLDEVQFFADVVFIPESDAAFAASMIENPEPATIGLVLAGLALMMYHRRRR